MNTTYYVADVRARDWARIVNVALAALLAGVLAFSTAQTARLNAANARINAVVQKAFYETLVAGDSSNPKFLLLGEQPVLLSIHWFDNHAGASIRRYADLIDAAMTNLSPNLGYRLETVDLDRFRKLPSTPR